jgi:hypothetical protein
MWPENLKKANCGTTSIETCSEEGNAQYGTNEYRHILYGQGRKSIIAVNEDCLTVMIRTSESLECPTFANIVLSRG